MRSPDGMLFNLDRGSTVEQPQGETAIAVETATTPALQVAAPGEELVQSAVQVPLARAVPESRRTPSARLLLAIAAVAAVAGVIMLIASPLDLLPATAPAEVRETSVAAQATSASATTLGLTTTTPPTAMIAAPHDPPTAAARPSATSAPVGRVVVTDDGLTIVDPVHMELVLVPAGAFVMGSDPTKDPLASSDEEPQHNMVVMDFFIGKFEVTNAQYAAFVGATGHRAPEAWENGIMPVGKENHPATDVSWSDAVAFAEWLRGETGRLMRLPSEAEWEKACRGPNGLIYPWGDTFDPDLANTYETGIRATTLVGKFSPDGDSSYAAADMAGNVWEWTISSYEDYPYDPNDGREAMSPTRSRVLRSGSFISNAGVTRCASRYAGNPNGSNGYGGFRVVIASPQNP
jgi:formylglycine-generating enzyme required for sulfatase activity